VDSLDAAQRAYANRSLRVSRNADRGTMSITIELPMETGELVAKALDKARDDSRQAGPRSELFNNPPAGGLLTGVDSFVLEPPSPVYWH
jgi:hypothetical protein